MEAGDRKPETGKTTNRLIHEKSPYLLQHASNPVDWYPWGEEAFERAAREGKPVFLSIGYATCHWCHVMAHESFEDPKVAALLNEAFVCIKVDREERPDIDGVYMAACQLTTGSGGWPLTVLLSPDKRPFFAGTYFPKKSRPNLIGMLDLVPRLQAAWLERSDEVAEAADHISLALQRGAQADGSQLLDEAVLDRAYQELSARFDRASGGFGTRPKFPTPHQLTFLLRYWRRKGEAHALAMVEKTLQAMRMGGIYDHVGHGFHRYSTDARWLVPHFEKMLYDQATLTLAYTEAFLATGNPLYRETAENIIAYVLRDMTAPEGGFYSAEDADSEGEEGKFYVWTEQELREVLASDEAELAIEAFNVTPDGNFFEEAGGHKTGANILHLTRLLPELAADLQLDEPQLRDHLETIRGKLFEVRKRRVHPLKDDKILTDWNGLTMAALGRAARGFNQPRYTPAAASAAAFIRETMTTEDGRLLHRYRDGEASIPAYLDDYAFTIWGYLELFETTFEVDHLKNALALNEVMLEDFWDESQGGLFFTAAGAEALPVRQKDAYDSALPSGNSVAMGNLLRLARLCANPELEERALTIGRVFSDRVPPSPTAYTQLLQGVDFSLGPAHEVVVAGTEGAQDVAEMLGALRARFLPNTVVVFRPSSDDHPLVDALPWTRPYRALEGRATAYVCTNYQCQSPTTDLDALLALLE